MVYYIKNSRNTSFLYYGKYPMAQRMGGLTLNFFYETNMILEVGRKKGQQDKGRKEEQREGMKRKQLEQE